MEQTEDQKKVIKDNICKYLEDGMYKKDAAVFAGIDKATFYRWVADDATFATRVEASILKYKHGLINMVTLGTLKTPRVGVDMLRMRWPKDYSLTNQVQITGEVHVKDIDRIATSLEKILAEDTVVPDAVTPSDPISPKEDDNSEEDNSD